MVGTFTTAHKNGDGRVRAVTPISGGSKRLPLNCGRKGAGGLNTGTEKVARVLASVCETCGYIALFEQRDAS
jgi:hypothetical protein